MVVDREDPRDVLSLRTQFFRYWRLQFIVSSLVLVVVSALGHIYAFKNGEIQPLPALVILGCYILWCVETFLLSRTRLKKMCKRLVVAPADMVRFYASDWPARVLEFNLRARSATMLIVPAMLIGLFGKWYLTPAMLFPAAVYASDALRLWKKLSW